MSQSEPVTILIISEHAESIKLITVSLRGFFSGCRVDVAYSAEEARAWAPSDEWTLILIDEQCLAGDHTSLLGEFKRRAPYAGIILYSDRSDSASALQALKPTLIFSLEEIFGLSHGTPVLCQGSHRETSPESDPGPCARTPSSAHRITQRHCLRTGCQQLFCGSQSGHRHTIRLLPR